MRLAVHLDVPPPHRVRLAYAIETMLGGLGLMPEWTEARPVLAVGMRPGDAPVRWTVSPQALACFEAWSPLPAADVARVETPEGCLPLPFGTAETPDWASSAFFWLGGWQEWTTRRVDAHGRFPYAAAAQHALGTPLLPVVDAYAAHLAAALRAAGVPVPGRRWAGRAWALCPTHDLDSLRKWTPKSLWRAAGTPGGLRSAWRLRDPYEQGLARLVAEERTRGVGATYFLKGGAAAPEDHAYALDHPALTALYAEPSFEVGLHPSYHGFDHPARLAAEQARLARAAERPITTIRHHYLRYSAASAGLQDALGFTLDSTLGFAEHEGFRRGTCRPYRVFDFEHNRPTGVWEMPLALMDTTLFGYRGLGADAAWRQTEAVLDAVKTYGGVCVALWHNDAWDASEAGEHFVRTLDAALGAGALVTSLHAALEAWQQAPEQPEGGASTVIRR